MSKTGSFARVPTLSTFTLCNISKYSVDLNNPMTYNHDLCHVFTLTVMSKVQVETSKNNKQEVMTKLQHEVRFLVAGTLKEIFILPCGETSIRSDTQHGLLPSLHISISLPRVDDMLKVSSTSHKLYLFI